MESWGQGPGLPQDSHRIPQQLTHFFTQFPLNFGHQCQRSPPRLFADADACIVTWSVQAESASLAGSDSPKPMVGYRRCSPTNNQLWQSEVFWSTGSYDPGKPLWFMEDPLAKAWIVDDTQYLIILNINLYGNRILNIVTNRNSWNSILLIADFILCPLSCRWPANKNDVCLLGSLKLEYPSKGFSSKRHRSETKDLIIKTPCSKALLLDDHMGLYYLICNWGYGSVWKIDQNRVRRNLQWFIIILNRKFGARFSDISISSNPWWRSLKKIRLAPEANREPAPGTAGTVETDLGSGKVYWSTFPDTQHFCGSSMLKTDLVGGLNPSEKY